jgi:hypothetical protein
MSAVPAYAVPTLGQLILGETKRDPLPTAYAGAIRVRGQRTAGTSGDTGVISLDLVVIAEPKVRTQDSFTVRVTKVVDEHGQELSVSDDPVPSQPVFVRRIASPYGNGFTLEFIQARLKGGEKPAKSLREVQGTLSARLFTEPRPVITVDDVLHSAGKTFVGAEGGAIKVLDVTKGEGGNLTLHFEFELPDAGVVAPGRGRAARGLPPGGAVPLPAAGPAAAGVPAAGRRVGGLQLLDDKGNILPAAGGVQRTGRGLARDYTMEFNIPAGRTPASFIYAATKTVSVDVPFTLKDVPLP